MGIPMFNMLMLFILLVVTAVSAILDNSVLLPLNGTKTMSNFDILAHKYLHLVEMAVTGSLIDEAGRCNGGAGGCAIANTILYDASLRFKGNDWPPFGHTMIGHQRLHNIRMALKTVVHERVEGHFAELGVWRGGACIYAKALLDVLNQNSRKVFVFDAFESLPNYGATSSFLENSEETVRHNFAKYALLDERVIFHKGVFKDSVPSFNKANPGMQLAVLRIDGNFYDSYQDALYFLYGFVPVGGFVIFDDIRSHPAVQNCWNDFKKDQGLPEELTIIDDHSAYFRKTVHVQIQFSYFKPPRDVNRP